MKRLLMIFGMLICTTVFAETYSMDWYMDGNIYAQTTCQAGDDIILPQTPYKYGYTFDGWIGYTPIEYLESTGTQWIDTEILPNNTTKTIISLTMSSDNMNAGQFFGSGYKNRTLQYILFQYPGYQEQKIRFDYNGTSYGMCDTGTSLKNKKILIDYSNELTVYDVNNNSLCHFSLSNNVWRSELSLILFGLRQDDLIATGTPGPNVKIHYTKIYDNNVLVRDFIPVLDMNGTPCMFDKVTKQFFYNQGTGNFIAGPAI